MANVNATIAAAKAGVPPTKVSTTEHHGRIRIFEATITLTAALVAGDTITWGEIPVGARTLGNMGAVYFGAGTAGATLTLGDAVNPARHLAATSIAAAGKAVPEAANAAGVGFVVSSNSGATNDGTLISTLAGAGMPIGQVVRVRLPYVMD